MAKGWMDDIVGQVRDRLAMMTDDIGASMVGSLEPDKPVEPKPPTLAEFLQAEPQQRQQILQTMPDSSGYISSLMNEAVNKYGALAAKITPALHMEQMAQEATKLETASGTPMEANMGILAAHEELTKMLGVDPFGPG